MPYDNMMSNSSKMGGYTKNTGKAKGFDAVQYPDRGNAKGEQYSGSNYKRSSTGATMSSGYKGKY